MKAISAHVMGFYRSSFHAYTTEVNVDGHRWRLGLRYSKFHEFYGELVSKDSDFHADFPPKGTLFFTPKPEERQEQLDVFLQQVLAYYAAKGHPAEIEDLLCDLLKVPRHLKSPEHEDDDVSTSTESVLDEPLHEPPSSSDSAVFVEKVAQKEEKPQLVDIKATEQAPVQGESSVAKKEVLSTPEPVLPASPVAEEPRPLEKTEAPRAHDEAEVEVETPAPAEEAELVKEMAEKETNDVQKEKEEAKPIAPQIPVEEPVVETKVETAAEEETIVPEQPVAVASPEEQSVAEPIAQERAPSKPQDARKPATSERTPPKDNVEQKELTASGRVSSWIAAYLPKSLLGFLRHRCMKKTNLVVLCVALLLPMVLARR